MTTYVALLTVNADGEQITGEPAEGRVLARGGYAAMLTVCRDHRVITYRHPDDGEVRTLTETERAGCANTNPELWEWVSRAEVLAHGEYAVPEREDMITWAVPTPVGVKESLRECFT